MRTTLLPLVLAGCLLAAGCAGDHESREGAPSGDGRSHGSTPADPAPSRTREPSRPTSAEPPPASTPPPRSDPRWVFYTDDDRLWRSPWYDGAHRVMIPFGCTAAPYYDPDPTCPGGEGKHHGIDVAMPCGTPLTAGRPAEVLDNAALGTAYGANPVLLRVDGRDVVIGHTTRVLVRPGERLAAGQRFALAGDSGAPDGCHLHFEVRPAGAPYTEAVDPRALLDLAVAGRS